MTVFEQIAQIVPTLSTDEQRQVLEVATRLRDGHKLPDITLPAAGSADAAWDAWSDRVRARSAVVMAEEKQRMQALGILDEQGNALMDGPWQRELAYAAGACAEPNERSKPLDLSGLDARLEALDEP